MNDLREEFGGRFTGRVKCAYRIARRIDSIPHDEAMSFLQKCGRRGMEEEGVRVLFGGLSLMLDKDFHKSTITNIVNRILIMLVEDCLGQPYIYVVARDLYRDHCHKKDLDTKEAIAAIVHMYGLVLGTTKGRMASIARLIKEAGSGKFATEWCMRFQEQIALPMTPSHKDHPIGKFKQLVKAGDLRCMTLLQFSNIRINDVWAGIKSVLNDDPSVPPASLETIAALNELYKLKDGHAEKELFLYQAIVLATFRKNVRSWTACCDVSDRLTDERRVFDEFRKYLSSIDDEDVVKLSVPDYCVDVHTARGRAAGKDAAVFAVEGATVTNADDSVVPHVLAAKYTEMYVSSKASIVPWWTPSTTTKKRKVAPAAPPPPTAAMMSPGASSSTSEKEKEKEKKEKQKKVKNLLSKINKKQFTVDI